MARKSVTFLFTEYKNILLYFVNNDFIMLVHFELSKSIFK